MSNKDTIVILATTIAAFGIGYLAGSSHPLSGRSHHETVSPTHTAAESMVAHDHSNHAHDATIDATAFAPSLALSVTKDAVAGWNVYLETENFTFVPEHASNEHVAGEGHAHLYVNGEKVARIYGAWYHLPSLPIGEHVIRASLHANSHEEYTVNGQPVADELVVVVSEQK